VTPETLQLILQLVVVAEQEIPAAVELISQVKKAIATDPGAGVEGLRVSTGEGAAAAIEVIDAWQREHTPNAV
jgi:hypothetical protein